MKNVVLSAIAFIILTFVPTTIAARVVIHRPADVSVADVTFARQTGGNGTAGAPAEVDLSDFSVTFDLQCVDGTFDQSVSGYIFYDASSVVADLSAGTVTLAQGEDGEVTVKGDLSGLDKDHIYLFVPWSSYNGQLGDPIYFCSSEYSDNDYADADNLRIYSHPQTGSVTVVSPDPMSEVAIYSLNGDHAQSVVIDGDYTVTMDLSQLTDGLYVLETTYSDGSIALDRIIKR